MSQGCQDELAQLRGQLAACAHRARVARIALRNARQRLARAQLRSATVGFTIVRDILDELGSIETLLAGGEGGAA